MGADGGAEGGLVPEVEGDFDAVGEAGVGADGGVPEEGAVAHEEGGAAEVADAAEGVAEVGVEGGLAAAAEGEDVGGFAFGRCRGCGRSAAKEQVRRYT